MSSSQDQPIHGQPVSQRGHAGHDRQHWTQWIHWRIGRDVLLLILLGFSAVGAVIGASTGIASLSQVEKVRASQERLLDGSPEQSAKFAGSNPSNPHLTLISENRERYLDVVIGQNRTEGWTLETNLPASDSGKRYQMWVRSGAAVLPVAFSGRSLVNTYFSFPANSTSVFVTQEPEAGSLQPTGAEVVGGDIPAPE